MRAMEYGKKHAKRIAGIAVLAIALFALIHRVSITANRLPLEVSQKVRNLSAREAEWRLATAVAPGDAVEHFMLIRLAADYPEPVRNIRVVAEAGENDQYREGSFASRALGEQGGAIFSKHGLVIPEIKPGEFVDLAWQTGIAEEVSFSGSEAPLISSAVTMSASGYSDIVSRAAASL
ncbi:MAG: hypothetical protein U1C18_02425, partial [Patescibacteria group bacterium]|nr:hypothetical protein [Patescibacteria group bacterium]